MTTPMSAFHPEHWESVLRQALETPDWLRQYIGPPPTHAQIKMWNRHAYSRERRRYHPVRRWSEVMSS